MIWLMYFSILFFSIMVPVILYSAMNHCDGGVLVFGSKTFSNLAKGAAIIMIVMGHLMGKFGGGITLFTPLGGIGVAMFLILSGYGLMKSWNSKTNWWRKRVVSVILPYIFVQVIAYWCVHDFNILDFILDISLIKPSHPNGWYLQYLGIWYVIFYVVMSKDFLRKNYKLAMLIPCILILLLWTELRAEQAFSFYFGVLLADETGNKSLTSWLVSKKGIAISIVIGIGFLALKQLDAVRMLPELLYHIIQMMIKCPLAIGTLGIIYHIGKRINLGFIELIGIISYEIFLVHGYILEQLNISVVDEIIFICLTAVMSVILWIINSNGRKFLLSKNTK